MLQLDGTVKCDISIITANKTVLSTTLFELEVQEAAAPDDSEIEKDEDYGILIQLIADVQAIKDAEAKRVTAENARVQAETKRQQDTSKAITDCNNATDSALKAAATMMIVNDDTGKTYQGAIKVIGGKPVFEYDEVVTG